MFYSNSILKRDHKFFPPSEPPKGYSLIGPYFFLKTILSTDFNFHRIDDQKLDDRESLTKLSSH